MSLLSPAVSIEIADAIATIRFNRPAERNPLSSSTLLELNTLLTDARANREIKAIIFTGSEDVFLSGANIRELAELDSDSALDFSRLGQQIFQTIADAKQITISAIDGYCMGGGLDLALACDIRVASATAVFSHPGARLGIITGWGGTQRLPRIIGKSAALEMILTARRMDAREALHLGLVTSVSNEPFRDALSMAQKQIQIATSSSEIEQFPFGSLQSFAQ
ncbi:MAG TPA: enoyl-CoA hydratase/isomerase family protein [Pyrinomonadaceae bacterium]|nr:enoyl-CoA hydratase/isomerase family protein [Pyrinomonadaceae bacterium]